MVTDHDLDDPNVRKEFNFFLSQQKHRKKMNILSSKEKKEIKRLEHQALGLWRQVVKKDAGGKCGVPTCKKVKFLNSHHIESYTTNKAFRYDPMNGICLCPTHHKFGWLSAHKSFCFMYGLLRAWYPDKLAYLRENYKTKVILTKEFLQMRIQILSSQLRRRKK